MMSVDRWWIILHTFMCIIYIADLIQTLTTFLITYSLSLSNINMRVAFYCVREFSFEFQLGRSWIGWKKKNTRNYLPLLRWYWNWCTTAGSSSVFIRAAREREDKKRELERRFFIGGNFPVKPSRKIRAPQNRVAKQSFIQIWYHESISVRTRPLCLISVELYSIINAVSCANGTITVSIGLFSFSELIYLELYIKLSSFFLFSIDI